MNRRVRCDARLGRPHESGQAIVEAALLLPILLLFLLGTVDLGRAFTIYVSVANAAREGARYCALHPGDTAGTRARMAGELGGFVVADTASVTCPPGLRGKPVTVRLAATFTPITPLVSSLTGGPVRIEAPATMVVW